MLISDKCYYNHYLHATALHAEAVKFTECLTVIILVFTPFIKLRNWVLPEVLKFMQRVSKGREQHQKCHLDFLFNCANSHKLIQILCSVLGSSHLSAGTIPT